VPAEFVGKARRLRDRIAEAHARWADQAAMLTAPLRPRDGFQPTPPGVGAAAHRQQDPR
jgi:hypothetical protein